MPTKKTGKAAARQQAEKIRNEVAVKESLEVVKKNEALVSMYKEYSQVGADNLGGSLPLLKIHLAGRSENELPDGSEPHNGHFFYTPTQEQYGYIDGHILTISRGFRAPGLNSGDEAKFNQLLAGVLTNEGEMKPFIMFVNGLKLQPMWDFAKVIRDFTKDPYMPIPLFALRVRIDSEEVKTDYGKTWVPRFTLARHSDGSPVVVDDEGKFQFLLDQVDNAEQMIEQIIENKTLDQGEDVIQDAVEPPHPAVVDEVLGNE